MAITVRLPDGREIEVASDDPKQASAAAKKFLQKEEEQKQIDAAAQVQQKEGSFPTAVRKTMADAVEGVASIPDLVTGLASVVDPVNWVGGKGVKPTDIGGKTRQIIDTLSGGRTKILTPEEQIVSEMAKGGFQGAMGGATKLLPKILPNTAVNALSNASAAGAGEAVRQGALDGVLGEENSRGIVPQLAASVVAGGLPQLGANIVSKGYRMATTPIDKIQGTPTGYANTLLDTADVNMAEGGTGLPNVGKYFEAAAKKIRASNRLETYKVSKLYDVAGNLGQRSVLQPNAVEKMAASIRSLADEPRSYANSELEMIDNAANFFIKKYEKERGVSVNDIAGFLQDKNKSFGGPNGFVNGLILKKIREVAKNLTPAEVGSRGQRAIRALNVANDAAFENFNRFKDPADIASIIGLDKNAQRLSNMQVAEIFKNDPSVANKIKAAVNTVKDVKTKNFVKENIIKGAFHKAIVDSSIGETSGGINPQVLATKIQGILRNEDLVSLMNPQQVTALRDGSNLLIKKFGPLPFADAMNVLGVGSTGGTQTKGLWLSIQRLFSGNKAIDLKVLENFLNTPSQEVAEAIKNKSLKDYLLKGLENSGLKQGAISGGISTLQNAKPQ